MARQVAGVAGEIARMGGLDGLDGQNTSAAAHAGRADAKILQDGLAIQRPVDMQGQIPAGHRAVKRQVLTHLGGALLEVKGYDARQN